MSVRKAADKYKIAKSTLGDRLSGKIADDAAPGKPPIIPKEAESKIAESLFKAADQGFGMSRLAVMKKAGDVCKKVGLRTPFKHGIPGKDWWEGFKKRNAEVSLRKPEKLSEVRSRAINPAAVGAYFVEESHAYQENGLQLTRQLVSSPHLIWNCDETGISMEYSPTAVVARRGTRNVPGRTSNSRQNITMMACINAVGTCMPPMFVIKGKTSKSLDAIKTEEGPPGSTWTHQKNAWMEDALGLPWFEKTFLKNCGLERPQLLLLDSHHSHETLSLLEAAKQNDIIIMAIPPHTTHYLCPLDRTVFGPFQRSYDSVCSDFMSAKPENIISKATIAPLIASAHDKAFTRRNIVSGFESTGICKFDAMAIPKEAFSTSAPFDANPERATFMNRHKRDGDVHPLQWVNRAILISQPETTMDTIPVASAPTHTITSSADMTPILPTQLYTNTQESFDIMPLATSNENTIPIKVVFAEPQNILPLKPIYTQEAEVQDATSILESLMAGGTTDTNQTSVLVSIENSPSLWDTEIDAIFSTPILKVSPSVDKKRKSITGHRVLTSDEILAMKREDHENKLRLSEEKENRKRQRESKKSRVGREKVEKE